MYSSSQVPERWGTFALLCWRVLRDVFLEDVEQEQGVSLGEELLSTFDSAHQL